MAYTKNLPYRGLSNSRVSSRSRQWVVLIAAIVIGMTISAAINAIPSYKASGVAKTTSTFENKR